jgi:hypothetical protein
MALALWPLVVGVAAAEPFVPDGSASIGVEAVVNDPFVARRGLRFGAAFEPWWWASVEASAAQYPSLGEGDWTELTHRLVEQYQVAPDISRIMSVGRASVTLWPLSRTDDRVTTRLGAAIGAAAVRTVDDKELLQRLDDDFASDDEVHPAWTIGLLAEAYRGAIGFRVRFERMAYRETILDDTLEDKRPTWVGVDLVIRTGG